MCHVMAMGALGGFEGENLDGTPNILFVRIVVGREGLCDVCGVRQPRGSNAQAVVATGRPLVLRCTSCFESGAEALPGDRIDMPREAPADLAKTQVTPLARLAGTGLALVSRGTRTVWRLLTTAGVATGAIFRGLWRRLRGERGVAPTVLRESFETLGPTYVKLGQLVASSQGLFPERYCREFQTCLDRVPPFPFSEVEMTLREELGRDPSEVFATIDPKPLASASIAQVHVATLLDGTEVVVKVQRPGIDRTVAADLGVMKLAARVMSWLPDGELANPVAIVEDFEQNLAEELDFTREAANMDEFNRIMEERSQHLVRAPRVRHELTSRRVIVMERFFGSRVDDVENIRARGIDGEAKLLLGLRAWFQCMIFSGFFHGDVHAGNLMALDDGRIGFLDFGIVGRFTQERRTQVTDYLLAFSTSDFDRLADVMVAMGSANSGVDRKALASDLGTAYEPMLSGGAAAVKYADLIPAIMRVSVKHRMRMPRDFVLVTKQMLYFDRYAKLLAPELNIFKDPRIVSALMEDVATAAMLAFAADAAAADAT